MSMGISDEFQSFDQRAVIKVCGIGGGGGNAVSRMIEAGLDGVEFISINTDAQALKTSAAGNRLQIGLELTAGLGSGARPEVGEKAAEEDRERVREMLSGADMVFLTAGLGGGTGTGASPIVAEEAAAVGALTVAIVTLPFSFEGPERFKNALRGLSALEKHVDTLIVVPNDRVSALCQNNVTFLNAFRMADEVLHNGVRAISELITVPGLINLDFADVRTIMQARGRALMGIGTAEGEDRAIRAAEEAIICPLLEQSNINGAMGVIVNIKGGCDIRMREVQEAVTAVKKSAHPDANIIFGAVVDESERADIQVTVIAAGFPKGVSETFLTTDSDTALETAKSAKAAPMSVARPAAPVAASAPRPAAKPQEAPVKREAAAPAAPATPAGGAPQEMELFPEEPVKKPEPVPEPEMDDMGIPAFLRKRLKRKS